MVSIYIYACVILSQTTTGLYRLDRTNCSLSHFIDWRKGSYKLELPQADQGAIAPPPPLPPYFEQEGVALNLIMSILVASLLLLLPHYPAVQAHWV